MALASLADPSYLKAVLGISTQTAFFCQGAVGRTGSLKEIW